MEALKKWLVGLDLTDHDESILKYTRLLSDILNPDHIEFVHIAHRFHDAEQVHLPPDLKYTAKDELLDKLNDKVNKYFPDDDGKSCVILEGPVHFDLWHETWEKEIDLFIAGRKPRHKGRGLFPRKFVRKSFCSVLFVPMEVPDGIYNIWIPSDFSGNSGEALELAIFLSKSMGQQAVINIHHIYHMPHAYYYEGFPKRQILMAVRSAAEEKYQDFMRLHHTDNIKTKVHYTELSQPFMASDIHEQALQNGADLILMASGGRSRLSNFFLGSETEQMAQMETSIPLLILKKKHDRVKLWDLLSPN